MTAGARGPLRTYQRAAGPTPETVLLLQAVRSYPSVSLLATTAPGERMNAEDARTLRGLAEEAADRLRAEDSTGSAVVLEELGEAMIRATSGPTEQAIAVFVNAGMQKIVHLPVPVADRAVIDPTFATRDLVRSLHGTPRHAVLVLTEREARLFEGVDDHLVPPARSGFPLVMPENRDANRTQVTAFLRIVDRALGTYLRLHPAPLVLIGAQGTVAEFRRISRNTGRLAGNIPCSFPSIPSAHLAPRIRAALERYLLSRQDEALQLVERRRRDDKVVEGLSAAWLAARWERPEMLAVEEGYFSPARISDDGDNLSAAEDTEHPDVIDDAVDELIETVLLRGGWVAFVDDGRLAEQGRLVLTTQ